MMNSINQIFISFCMIWILYDTNVMSEATRRATGYGSNDNTHNLLAFDATNEQQQPYITASNPAVFADARIPAAFTEGIAYHDMPPVNYPILAAAPTLPKYCTQPLYAAQLNSGQNIYRTYDMPTTPYDRMPVPIVQSAPIANLYMPPAPAPAPPPPSSLVKSASDPYGLPLQPTAEDPFISNAFSY